MADQAQAAAAESDEGEPAADPTEETPPAETPAPVEGEPKPEGDKPAESAEPAAAAPVEIPEDVLKAAAVKFANRTMAAARRAESRAESIVSENTQFKARLAEYDGFIEKLKAGDVSQLQRVGFNGLKHFLEVVRDAGGGPKTETTDDRVARLEKERADERAEAKRGEQSRAVDESKRAVFAAVDKETERFDLCTSDIGHAMLWDAIVAYNDLHGTVPDAAVYMLADAVEKDLTAKLAKTRKFSGPRPAEQEKGAPAGGQAATPARNGGKTLTSAGGKGAPVRREYSMDPDERRKQIDAELRAEGIIH